MIYICMCVGMCYHNQVFNHQAYRNFVTNVNFLITYVNFKRGRDYANKYESSVNSIVTTVKM
jgi:hypothetical protein